MTVVVTKDWGTFDTQLGKVRDAVSDLTADLGPSPKLADVERSLALVRRWLDGKA
jgi:hypothetical protein